MSKTVEIQIEKSRNLVEGLRRHVREMGERGVTNDEINTLEQAVKELEAVNAEVDSIREQLSPTLNRMKIVMNRVKEAYTEKKKTLKGYYPQERWMDYGIPDKR
jgi:predicted  nucleic acid-binding Zn-ribbon protein